jgi:gliding-associated putative ABC transporter substrate-binding component GldG
MAIKQKYNHLINLGIVVAILLVLNILSQYAFFTVDLTEEKRYTLTQPTLELLEEQDNVIYAQLLLDGELPSGFKRLQGSAIDMLRSFRKISNGRLEYEVIDPSAGTVEEINATRTELSKQNILPVNMRLMETGERKEKLIYPYVIFRIGDRTLTVNILENEAISFSPQVQLNNSVSLLEYKFASAIQKLKDYRKKNIVFLTGHGELRKFEHAELSQALRPYYNTGDVMLDSIYQLDPELDLLIISKPRGSFSERDKFIIDQYIMHGGKTLWMLDKLNVNLDSIRLNKTYIPFEYPLNLDDQFFRYGFRINADLVQDLECTRIPMVIGRVGNSNQYDLFGWYYHPLAMAKEGHPITNNLDRINLLFPSTIDTIKTKYPIKKTSLLTSSDYSKFQLTPLQLSFDILRHEPVVEKFNKPRLPMAYLMEGRFASLYENRVSESMKAGLEQINVEFKNESQETAMIVIADGDIARNKIKAGNNEMWPLGYNVYEKRKFANKEFLINCIEYLMDDSGVLESRTKNVKLRLLNTVKAKAEKNFWQFVNVGIPIALLFLSALVFGWLRRRRYGRKV